MIKGSFRSRIPFGQKMKRPGKIPSLSMICSLLPPAGGIKNINASRTGIACEPFLWPYILRSDFSTIPGKKTVVSKNVIKVRV